MSLLTEAQTPSEHDPLDMDVATIADVTCVATHYVRRIGRRSSTCTCIGRRSSTHQPVRRGHLVGWYALCYVSYVNYVSYVSGLVGEGAGGAHARREDRRTIEVVAGRSGTWLAGAGSDGCGLKGGDHGAVRMERRVGQAHQCLGPLQSCLSTAQLASWQLLRMRRCWPAVHTLADFP